MSYTEKYTPEGKRLVRYDRTESSADGREVTVQVYLTAAYIQNTEKRVIENYLNYAVESILTRNGAIRNV